MNFRSRLMRGIAHIPAAKELRKLLRYVHVALGAFIVTCVALFICILIASAYLLMLLLRRG